MVRISNGGFPKDDRVRAAANDQQLKLKCLTVLDEYTRECSAIDVAGCIRSSRVIPHSYKLHLCRGNADRAK